MERILFFIRHATVEQKFYLILVLYLTLTIPAYTRLYIGATKEIEKLSKEKDNEDLEIKYLYLYISALFYPLLAFFQIGTKVLLKLIDVLHFIIECILDLLWVIFGGICCLIMLLPFFNEKGDKGKMTKQKTMTKDNVLLYEKHDVTTTEAVNGEDGKTVMVHGVKIFRVIKPENGEFNVIAQYLAETDSIDLSPLHDYVGWYMVCVDRDSYNHEKFVWNCVELGEGTENSEMFTVNHPRACTVEEVSMLNELFPEYFDHAF